MIGHNKGDDINTAIKGPISYIGAGIIILAIVIALANDWSSQVTPPDESVLFGGYLADLIYEVKYYMFAIVPLILVGGGVMVALQLRIHVNSADMSPKKYPKFKRGKKYQ